MPTNYGTIGSCANTAPAQSHTNHTGFFFNEASSVSPDFVEDARFVLGDDAGFQDNLSTTRPASGFDSADDHNTIPGFFHANVMDFFSEYRVQDLPWPPQQPIGSTLSVTPASSQPPSQGPMTCSRGCRGTFGRPEEYRRHMRKHGPRNIFCTQSGCTMAFYRKDKLNDHLRQAHKIIQTERARRAAAIGSTTAASTAGGA